MSNRSYATTNQGSAFYVNINTVLPTNALDETGAAISPPLTRLSGGPGSILLRDMGRTIRVSTASSNYAATPSVNLVLRKVQIVEQSPIASSMPGNNAPINNFVGFNEGVGSDAFYIQLSPVSLFARINM